LFLLNQSLLELELSDKTLLFPCMIKPDPPKRPLVNLLRLMLALKLDLPLLSDLFKKINNIMESADSLTLFMPELVLMIKLLLVAKKFNGKLTKSLMLLPLTPLQETSQPMVIKLSLILNVLTLERIPFTPIPMTPNSGKLFALMELGKLKLKLLTEKPVPVSLIKVETLLLSISLKLIAPNNPKS
jgi:hypothetical protein